MKEKKNIRKNSEENKKNNVSNDTIFNKYFKFYKEKLRRTHLIIYILLLLIFFITVTIDMNNAKISQEVTNNLNDVETIGKSQGTLSLIVKEKIPLSFLMIFGGFTPFVYIPTLGLLYPYLQSGKLVEAFYSVNKASNLIFTSLGCIIQYIGLGLSIATGIYYCGLSSKKFRYNQRNSYSFDDVKKNFYSATKKEEKLEILTKKMEKKSEEKEKLNVKIPYKMFLISFIISALLISVGTLISGI